MSTPPFVALPRGVERIVFPGGFGDLAALIAHPEVTSRGTVLLIPGFTGSKEDFIAVFPMLRDLGYTVASYDHRGQFESVGPDSDGGYLMTDFVADALRVVGDLVERTQQPIHLVGHSFGGLVARETVLGTDAAETRELFTSLTLLASGPGVIPGELRELAQQFIDFLPEVPLELIWEQKEELDRGDRGAPMTDEVDEFLKRRFVSNNPNALRAKALLLMTIPDRVDDLARRVSETSLPSQVAFGDIDDRWTPAEQEMMAQRLSARRFRWRGVGHSPAAEAPALTATTLEAFFADAADKGVAVIPFENDQLGYASGMELRIPVPSDPKAVRAVRKTAARMLEAWGLDTLVDDIQIVVSEVVTNAIRYGADPVVMTLAIVDDRVRLAVTDTNVDAMPTTKPPTETEASGRGLHLIDGLATEWGVDEAPDSKTVWAEFEIPQTA